MTTPLSKRAEEVIGVALGERSRAKSTAVVRLKQTLTEWGVELGDFVVETAVREW
jgi:hypothetical protein